LYNLFDSVGWIKSPDKRKKEKRPSDSIANHILYVGEKDKKGILEKSFQNSAYVVSAWDNKKLIGTIRVISDGVQRSILYDLAVLPEYQGRGIGKSLVEKCLKKFSKTQITLGTSSGNFRFYKKFGFKRNHNYLEKESIFF